MHSSSLLQLITADALRAAIRAVGLLQDIRRGAHSLPRGLAASNGVVPLRRELGRLRGLGDLLTPVSTTGEAQVRVQRLDGLSSLLPHSPTLLQAAQASVAPTGASGQRTGDMMSALRGELVAADEMYFRALDEKIRRQLGPCGQTFTGQLQAALDVLHAESSSWRVLENSRLANRLIGDHGFANTYGQARKRARALVREQASKGRSRPKTADVRAFDRWHSALVVQLDLLVNTQAPGQEVQVLHDQLQQLGARLGRWLALVRLRAALSASAHWDDTFEGDLDELSADILGSLQRSYGLGKSNFRALVMSEIAPESVLDVD